LLANERGGVLPVKNDKPMTIHSFTLQPGRGTVGFLVLVLACASISVAAADKNYTVKRYDTLTDLAHKNG